MIEAIQTAKKYRKRDILFSITAIFAAIWLFHFGIVAFYRSAYPIKYSEAVETGCRLNDLPPALVYAVIRTESGFNPDAVSSVGATGLMQITKDTHHWVLFKLGEEAKSSDLLFDCDENIRIGTALLRLLLDEFDSVENALCAYHAGWGNAKSWLSSPEISPDGTQIENIPFGDTERYVRKVLETQKIYENLYR